MLLENYLQRLFSFQICVLRFIICFFCVYSCFEDLYMTFVVHHTALLHAFTFTDGLPLSSLGRHQSQH